MIKRTRAKHIAVVLCMLGAISVPVFAQADARVRVPTQQSAAPATVSAEQFRSLRWLVGRWRGIGYGRLAAVGTFYEEYEMLNDSTMRMRTLSDSTFRVATDSTLFELRGAILTARAARGTSQFVVRIARDSVQWSGTGTLYARITNDIWRAAFPARPNESERPFYELRRAQ